MKWRGDIRFRGQSEKQQANVARVSEKLRVRLGVDVDLVPEILRAEFRLATTKNHRSTNQGIGDDKDAGAPRRSIGLDLAYAEWRPLGEMKVDGGRIPQLHFRPGASQVILDEDIALEGAGVVVDVPLFAGRWSAFGSFGTSWIRENYDSYYSENQTDNMLNWGQIGLRYKIPALQSRIGGGFFNFVGLEGRPFTEIATGGTASGNTESSTTPGEIKNQYLPREIFADVAFSAVKVEWSLFAEKLINRETTDPRTATWAGITGTYRKIEGQFAYGKIESDVVPAIFTNSDFGAGQTNVRGTMMSVKWAFMKNISLKFTQFENRLQISSTQPRPYHRSHLDFSASF